MVDLLRSDNESKKTHFDPKDDSDENQEINTTSGHSNTCVNDVQPSLTNDVQPSLTSKEAEETLSKRKRKRLLKHEQWLQRKEQKK